MNVMYYHAFLAFSIRVLLILYSTYQDSNYLVKYTDVDYYVYSDAAEYLYSGTSPFSRHTYRYTPILALLLCPNIFLHCTFGKLLFSVFDVLSGVLVWKILCSYGVNLRTSKMCSLICLYNPMFAVISTRGSSDSIVTVLILITVLCVQRQSISMLGIIYGFSVHFRMYPGIYAFGFYFALGEEPQLQQAVWSRLWQRIQPNICRVKFSLYSALGFALPTLLSYYFYGMQYLNEAFLYHLTRKDTRHNFSPYFYALYLTEASPKKLLPFVSLLPFLFQVILLLLVAWTFGRKQTLPVCLFVQTFVFVHFNKVCTSQYFLWYLCLFPLILPILDMKTSRLLKLLFLWVGAQVLWLVAAYQLEFQGENMFLEIWVASLLMFLVNVYLLYCILSCVTAGVCVKPNKLSKVK